MIEHSKKIKITKDKIYTIGDEQYFSMYYSKVIFDEIDGNQVPRPVEIIHRDLKVELNKNTMFVLHTIAKCCCLKDYTKLRKHEIVAWLNYVLSFE
jgi:hypothetical protein